jgi:glucose/arabinose dehydrogenase
MTARRALVLIAILVLPAASLAGTPPAGFVDSTVADAISFPTGAAYEPGTGRLWVLEKGGFSIPVLPPRVLVVDRVTHEVGTALSVGCVDAQGERGLLGIAFSPDYLSGPGSRWVYLYYTRWFTDTGGCSFPGYPAGSRNRVSRFLESGGTLSGEQVLFDGPPLTFATNHNGGTVRFAPDGTLFFSMGDNNTGFDANPLARNLTDPRGKLLRIRADGTVPEDNPFVGQGGRLPQIWAWGLRNPYRFSIDPASGVPFIGDVGDSTWEEIDIGIPGADYGYPCFEGPSPLVGCNPVPAPTAPALYYGRQTGSTVVAGPVYRAAGFPASQRDRFYFGDFGSGWIRSARVDAGNALSDVQTFVPDAGSVVDLLVSPEGCLTYVVLGGSVHEVCFTGGDADFDGDGVSPNQGDCDDSRASTFPGAPDICDGLDNGCNGTPDDDTCDRYETSGDGRVDGVELSWIGRAFGACSADPAAEWWFAADYDRDGCIEGDDLAVLGAVWACSGSAPICP